MRNSKLPQVFISVLIILVIVVLGLIYFLNRTQPVGWACTADAKICEDGTAVGREGPKCEFAACPDTSNYATLRGTVKISPACSVVIEDAPCLATPDMFFSRGISIQYEADSAPRFVNFDAEGKYSIKLPAGKYTVSLIPNGVDSSKELPVVVNLSAKEIKQLDFTIDTGIR